MARTPVWKSIAATLEDEILKGHYRPGGKLPTEAALAARFGVNRHTVRHAIADMAGRGVVRSRRGSGVFVETEPTEYPIGKRVRFHQNIRASGRLPQKTVLRVEERGADLTEAKALEIDPGAPVIVYEGLSFAEGQPIAHFISVFPAAPVPGLAKTLEEVSSVTEALKRNGIPDYVRSETRISVDHATPTQALHLKIGAGDALLKSVGVNRTEGGLPIEFGTTWFAGDKVTLTVMAEG
ncbi:phosphonate metabolism transcriptional regulator PhnF [Maritimibacter alexandrii]|uniref:phosphonate metabolism transcriptional regulator PhnF n=1 Tax=Maritimibacter alexandrii TaxID=2570355 RepID=UPI0011086E74|nr:phosphonate metabolism transcriptional regulator PhnF [Maritimibacter alexandrii]